jgi:thymidine phosphorylase
MVDWADLGTSLDERHREMCITVGAMASCLVRESPDYEGTVARMNRNLQDGTVLLALRRHLEAQGSSEGSLRAVLQRRLRHPVVILQANGRGYWRPPTLEYASRWIKAAQRENDARNDGHLGSADAQVGIRLVVSPGDFVEIGAPVIEIRGLASESSTDCSGLSGTVEQEPIDLRVLRPKRVERM